jgi:hypothetical protein
MAWPKSTHFGSGRNAAVCGRKGGQHQRPPACRSAEWLQGYQAGWLASERWFHALGRKSKRGRHGREDAA